MSPEASGLEPPESLEKVLKRSRESGKKSQKGPKKTFREFCPPPQVLVNPRFRNLDQNGAPSLLELWRLS